MDGVSVAGIGQGLVVLVGIAPHDAPGDAEAMARKVAELRVFRDRAGKTNLSLLEVAGSVLAVSQFTLFADTRRGRRPSFLGAASPAHAASLYEAFARSLELLGVSVGRGVFGAHMELELVNDGPMTIWLDNERPDA